MKMLQARKMSTSTELTIGSEKSSSEKGGIDSPGFMKEQVDIISALSYLLPYFSQGNLKGAESTLLPFIQLLFSNVQDGDNSLGYLKYNTKNSSFLPASNSSSFTSKLKKLYFLQNLLDAEIQEKVDEVKKKEKTVMVMQFSLFGPKFRCQIFPKKLECAQAQENSLTEVQHGKKMLQRVKMVLEERKHAQNSLLKEVRKQKVRVKWITQPFLENATKERSLRTPFPGELEQQQRVPRPRKLAGYSFHIQPSFTEEQKAAVSALLKHHSMGRPHPSIPAKAPTEVRKTANDFTYNILVSENANARVKTMEGPKPVLHPGKLDDFHKTHSLMAHKTPKAKLSEKFRKENTHSGLMVTQRPPFSAARSLAISPSGRLFSSSRDLSFQENPVSELYAPSELSVESTPVENHTTADTFEGKDFALDISVPEETVSEKTTHKNPSVAHSAVTAFNAMPAANQTREAQWKHPNTGTDSPAKDSTSLSLSSAGDQFETYLNQHLWPLIPNNDIRRLISHIIRNLKMDCSEAPVQLACAKLISKTGLLMKLLSEQQKVKVSKAQWDADHWKSENYINESTEDQSEEKEQESRELMVEVPGYGYKNKLIFTISVTGVAMILMIIFCLTKGFSQHWHGRCNTAHENEEGVPGFGLPLWLRDMYRPISASHVEKLAAVLHDKDSSDKEEIFTRDMRELHEVTTKAVPTELAIEEESWALKEVSTE